MPVVPIRPGGPIPGQPMLKPPDPTFLMMAAAQMHSEGRLVKPPEIPPAVRGDPFDEATKALRGLKDEDLENLARGPQTGPPGFAEWETQPSGRQDDEPHFQPQNPQPDDVRRLFRNRILGKATQSNI